MAIDQSCVPDLFSPQIGGGTNCQVIFGPGTRDLTTYPTRSFYNNDDEQKIMPRLQLKNGTVVQVSDTGVADKTQIVFIHGLGSSENFYGAVIASLKDRRCVSFDTPGAARSPVPAKVQSFKTISEDVIALLDTLGIPRAVLVGHSMGGIIASQTAADFPERVEKLVLIGPVNPSVNPSPEASEVWTQRIKLVQNGTA